MHSAVSNYIVVHSAVLFLVFVFVVSIILSSCVHICVSCISVSITKSMFVCDQLV